jgi:uncharacterized protein
MAPEPSGCFVQFAKAPVPGRAKTRLQPRLGSAGAASVAQWMTSMVNAALRDPPTGWQSVLCVDIPEHPFFRDLSRETGCPVWAQGEGDLGERMARAFLRALEYVPAAIIVGSDCPGYDPGYLLRATRLLDSGAQAVLGPAVDGGYVLLGLRECPPRLFEGMPWGTSEVAWRQRQLFASTGLGWHELPPRADVDRPGDLWMVELSPPLRRW